MDDEVRSQVVAADILYAASSVAFISDDENLRVRYFLKDVCQHACKHLESLRHLKNDPQGLISKRLSRAPSSTR